jgi:hypothetical protein
MLTRRSFAAAAPLMLASPALAAAPGPAITIYKTASCGCCGGWITTMQRAGYRTKVVTVDDVSPVWRKRGVPDELSSCHLADVGGYTIVGHVPPADVAKLLKDKPKAIGIAVPGMPWGSPGMERPDGKREAYDTLLLLPGGKTRVFARHA